MALSQATEYIKYIEKELKQDVVSMKEKDILVQSKNREEAKKKVEKWLKTKKVPYKSVFKKSKSSSLDVLTVSNFDIVFKPIIAKGQGGRDFEHQLEADLNNYFNGVDIDKLTHGDVITALVKEIKLTPTNNLSAMNEGSKNQKRALTFDGNKIEISNSTGKTLTDVTINCKAGPPPLYLSLKMSQSYYTLSASIGAYFADKKTKVAINTFFGLNGQWMGGFGKEYRCVTPKPNYTVVAKNLASVLSQAVGKNVILVHKKTTNDVLVKKVGNSNKVTVSSIDQKSYSYPIFGVRKYANIKFDASINGVSYKVNFQFRGTTAADVGPKYLRILLERT
jgi:hypothetical protein